jgi:hypothetical protein
VRWLVVLDDKRKVDIVRGVRVGWSRSMWIEVMSMATNFRAPGMTRRDPCGPQVRVLGKETE